MADREKIMSGLEGLAQDDWRQYHSDSEVQQIARDALELLKEDDFFDWLACSVILDDSNWEEAPGFYREVICRKLVRMGKVILKDY